MMLATQPERVIWQAFPSWGHFSWLYFFMILTALRGIVFLRFGLPGWQMWIVGAIVLLLVIVVIRRWAYYIVTPTQVIIKNGYTQHEIAYMKLEMIESIALLQGPIARFWGIGTLVIQSSKEKRELRLRGIKDPHVAEAKIKALLPAK
ncbi:MAG: hypothetical protein NPIRA02_25950 [Nitrospirales bacterium]|nr:MAG: hypothetical protein NPIRA02_25950 [Nitrospirales bacterium]